MNRKLLFSLLAVFLLVGMLQTAFAQPVAPPAGISYQAVARNPAGAILANTTLTSVRISILSSISPATVAYEEIHNGVTTNGFGLFTLVIGGGTPTVNGAFNNLASITWGTSEHFAKIEVDQGLGYIDMGTVKLWSVPYALFAGNATNPGPTGPQGPAGTAGVNGVNGVAGPTGPQGIQGPQGATGSGGVGPQGPTGPTGAGVQGPAGPAGANGAQGPTGANGAQGPAGPAGVNGAQGPAGIAGPAGPAGANGAQGPAGPAGIAGPAGPAGADGIDGAVGPQGPVGPAGVQGPIGPTGNDGSQGPAGTPGAPGVQGPVGADGPAGPTGNDGVDGVDGAVGPAGPAGADGIDGVDGAVGPAGPVGPAGTDGIDGVDGAVGPTGVTGVTGPTGSVGTAATLAYNNTIPVAVSDNNDTPIMWQNFDFANSNGLTGITFDGNTRFTNTSGDILVLDISGYVTWDDPTFNGNLSRYVFAVKNGNVLGDRYGSSNFSGPETNAPVNNFASTIVLQDGDYFEIYAWHNQLGLTNINSQVTFPGSRIIISNLSGAQGPAGVNGVAGPAGPAGPVGADGIDGVDGVDGAPGPVGPAGPAGADGVDGAAGPAGPAGADGVDGVDGAVGPAGPAGPVGPAGADGVDGVDGAAGPAGPAGADGVDGAVGPAGPAGPTGDPGPVGPTGVAGNAWDLFGNANTDPNDNYVGTSDGQDLSIRTNGTEYMHVYQNGTAEVGSPDGTGATANLQITAGVTPSLGYKSTGTGDEFNVSENSTGQLTFGANGGDPANSSLVAVMDDGTYNVGIGTAVAQVPTARLHVVENGLIGNFRAGFFQSSLANSSTEILRAEYNGAPTLFDIIALSGYSVPSDGHGYGGYFTSGFVGTQTSVLGSTPSSYFGGRNNVVSGQGGVAFGTHNDVNGSVNSYGVMNIVASTTTTTGNSYGVFNALPDASGLIISPMGVNNYGVNNIINGGEASLNAGSYTTLTGGEASINYGAFNLLTGGEVSNNFGTYSKVTGGGGSPTALSVGSYTEVNTLDNDLSIGGVFQSLNGPVGTLNTVSGGTGLPVSDYDVANSEGHVAGSAGVANDISGVYWADGVYGLSSSASSLLTAGVYGIGENGLLNGSVFGVVGYAATNGTALFNVGVYGYDATSAGILNYAGYFDGDVHVGGTLSKLGGTFKIDHPQDPANKYLIHSFVESPDMMNVYNGNIVTDATGTAVVSLPSYFEAENKDFKYQLTVIGTFAQAIVFQKVSNNQFVIKTNQPNVEVSWQVTGVRNDAWANDNRVIAEVEKPTAIKGYYLYPQGFGFGKEKAISPTNAALLGNGTPAPAATQTLSGLISNATAAGVKTAQTATTNTATQKANAEAEKTAHPAVKAPEKGTFTSKPVVEVKEGKNAAPATTTPATKGGNR